MNKLIKIFSIFAVLTLFVFASNYCYAINMNLTNNNASNNATTNTENNTSNDVANNASNTSSNASTNDNKSNNQEVQNSSFSTTVSGVEESSELDITNILNIFLIVIGILLILLGIAIIIRLKK